MLMIMVYGYPAKMFGLVDVGGRLVLKKSLFVTAVASKLAFQVCRKGLLIVFVAFKY